MTQEQRTPDGGFDDLDPDPIVQFAHWFREASASGLIQEPAAMSVASVGPEGPSARIVLLRRFDERGFCFFTNYQSRKGRELQADPRVAAVFYWDPLRRQVRVTGRAEKTTDAESDDYHASRAPGSQVAAWASDQSRPIESRQALEARYAAALARFGGAPVPRPPHWGGFRLVPSRIEFWQARENRLHDRIVYERGAEGAWSRQRLMP